jgi:hypothetical protein
VAAKICIAMNSPCIITISLESLVINLYTKYNDFLTAYGVCVCVEAETHKHTHTHSEHKIIFMIHEIRCNF